MAYYFVTSFDRLRMFRHSGFRDNRDFKRWFGQLKRCFPRPEWVLAELLGLDLAQLWRWKTGGTKSQRRTVLFIGYLIAWRIGAVANDRDMLRVKEWMATGELETMVDAFLEAEGKAELKRHLRYARSRGEL